jgi:hypothetical protein
MWTRWVPPSRVAPEVGLHALLKMKAKEEAQRVEDPEVSTVEWDEGSFLRLDDATIGSNVGAC